MNLIEREKVKAELRAIGVSDEEIFAAIEAGRALPVPPLRHLRRFLEQKKAEGCGRFFLPDPQWVYQELAKRKLPGLGGLAWEE